VKYKVGDKVWIKSWDDILKCGDLDCGDIYFENNNYAPFVEEMKSFCGKKVEIMDIEDDEYIIEGHYYINDLCIDFKSYDEEFDIVKRPKHYADKEIEVIDYIKDTLTKEEFQGYLSGNILKYISRYNLKNGVEDLKKARYYLEKLISILE